MILFRNDDWLAVDKPTGLATHAGQPGELGVAEWLALHLDLQTHVVSRLDRGTSGVLLLARNAAASARAQQIHAAGTARKVYEFWSTIDSLIDGPGDTWMCNDALDGKPAVTHFTRLGQGVGSAADGRIRYRAEIAHGRRHQIRRHAAAGGVPVLGDDVYGGAPFGRLCLHCVEVIWPEIETSLAAPPPPSFQALQAGAPQGDVDLALCRDRRGAWPSRISDAWRAVHRDELPGLPVAIDIYGAWFNAVWFDEAVDEDAAVARLEPVLQGLMADQGCRGGVVRGHHLNPHQKNLVGFSRSVGSPPPDMFTVSEHGLRYEIRLQSTQHPGLFLDQRDTRRRVARAAAGRRLSNLFAFTCSFSVAAAAAGAEITFAVDTAKACLRTGMDNFAHNDLTDTGRGKFVQQDVRKWLARQVRTCEERPDEFRPFDVIICDPPVFAGGGSGRFSLVDEWARLAAGAARILGSGGVAVFANNHRGGDHGFYRQTLEARFAKVTDLRPPLDFPVAAGRPHHVRTFWCLK